MANPKIALLGNCQASALFRLFHLFAPSAVVVRFPLSELSARFATKEELFTELDRFDQIFSPPFGIGFCADADGMVLKERFRDRFYFYPVVEFSAFHPDCVYIWHRDLHEYFQSPIGDYHSALSLLGHSLRFTIGQTVSLFRAAVFERLGYFAFWKPSEDVLLGLCRSIEFPIGEMYRSWVRRGIFMHTINHPKLFVLADVARALLRMSCSFAMPGNAEDFVLDESLYGAVWPVYPEIAEAMSLDGGTYTFKCGSRSEDNPFLTLTDLVARSYELYERESIGALECQRVEKWMADAPLVEYLRSHAAG